jgi:hypothetical protein
MLSVLFFNYFSFGFPIGGLRKAQGYWSWEQVDSWISINRRFLRNSVFVSCFMLFKHSYVCCLVESFL